MFFNRIRFKLSSFIRFKSCFKDFLSKFFIFLINKSLHNNGLKFSIKNSITGINIEKLSSLEIAYNAGLIALSLKFFLIALNAAFLICSLRSEINKFSKNSNML